MYFKIFLATNNKYISVIAHSTHWIDIWAYRKYFWTPPSTKKSWNLTHYCGNKVQNLTQTLMWVNYNTFMFYFPRSPVHKICLLFTELNSEKTHRWDVFVWTGNLRTLFCLTKRWQIQIIYRFTWKYIYLFTLCLFKVGRLFSKLAIPKYMFVFVIKLSKEKAYFMYGWTWEMEHKMYYLVLRFPVHMKTSHQFTKKCKYRTMEKYSNTYYENKQNINPACACNTYLINSIILFYLFIF
jgi:hypothetical protein